MPGFATIGAYADAASDDGKNWLASFRKVPAVSTIAGQWFDFSGAAGNPVPNYYASSPLTAAVLDPYKGILHGPNCSPARKHVYQILTMHGAGSATTTTGQNVEMIFMDYVLYYPFIDMDAAGEVQEMDNTVTLPRWATGAGVKLMMVAQATTIGGGQFTIGYTNQDGTAGRVTPNHLCAAAQPQGTLVPAMTATTGLSPFVALQAGDTGVRSVESVTFSVANGGLCVLVLVKPIQNHFQREESRTTVSGTLESFGSPAEVESIRQRAGISVPIEDNAFIGFIGRTAAGNALGGQYMGLLRTVWG